MKIDWILIGWIIDMILNGVIWLIIAAFLIPLVGVSDKWILKILNATDEWARKLLEDFFEWIEKKNLKILAAFLFMIIFGVLSQLGILPKLIT